MEYLERIGAERPTAPTPEALRDLHARHQLAVPFENLSIHLGEPIVLDEDSLVDKIVLRRRGGFCYELNGAFGHLLTALGFAVSYLAAGVFGEGGAVSPLFDLDPFEVCGRAEAAHPGRFALWARNHAGALAMQATAELA